MGSATSPMAVLLNTMAGHRALLLIIQHPAIAAACSPVFGAATCWCCSQFPHGLGGEFPELRWQSCSPVYTACLAAGWLAAGRRAASWLVVDGLAVASSSGRLRRLAGGGDGGGGLSRLACARLLAASWRQLVVVVVVRATSAQARLPAELKHIAKRWKRNQTGFPE